MADGQSDLGRTQQPPIYTIQTNSEVGRYLAAARDIKPGEVIFKEAPLIIGPRLESAPVCLSCFHVIATPHTCSNCHLAELCSPACETNPNHAGKECELLANAIISLEDFQYLTSNYDWVLPFRIMINIKYNAEKRELWQKFQQLEAHMEERRNTWIWESHRNSVIQGLQNVGLISKDEEEEELAQKVCGILDVNSFEIRSPDQELLRGIYLEASMMSHDCIGNTHLAVDKDYVMTVRASLPIAKGEKILFNYTGPLQGTECRRDILRKGKYFECKCVRCDDPTELGTYMSAIRCPKCRKGYIINDKDQWACQDCKKKFSTKMIQTVLDVGQGYVEDANKFEQHALELLLNRMSTTFHTNHFLMLDLKQRLLSIYRDMILLGSNMSSRILQRDIELCHEVLPVIETVEPGLSRLREGNVIENFKKFKQEVEIYFTATETYEKPEKVQTARLLNLMGEEALRVYNTFGLPSDEETVESILHQFEQYLSPKKNEIMEHFKFFSCKQKESEPFIEYLTRLKSQLKNCDFGDMEEKLLKTQIILGLFDPEMQSRLLREDTTLKKIINYCQACEEAEHHKRELQNETDKVFSVSTDRVQRNIGKQFICNRCNRNHTYRNCPAFGRQCNLCKGYNHFSACCKKKKSDVNQDVNQVSHADEEEGFDINSIGVLDITDSGWFETIIINGVNIRFKIDTGASVNVIPEDMVQQLNVNISNSKVQLEGFGGHIVQPLGKFVAVCESKFGTSEELFYVCNCKIPLLSMKSSIHLKLLAQNEVLDINLISKEEFIKQNEVVFKGLGAFPDIFSLKLKSDAVPVGKMARRVPFKIKEKLKSTLNEYVERGIITPCEAETNNNSKFELKYLPGITLYTLHLPVVLLANKEIQCGNMDHNQFLSKLEEAEALLKEALALLFYEPAKTPEGMLAIEAKEALKCLRETIMDVKDQVVTSHMRSIQ
ncbi:hypothetical protein M8J77_010294 [Diaphorina citri]|nr:hypothetical protein M8J77_010294 [Diaphorina citri]